VLALDRDSALLIATGRDIVQFMEYCFMSWADSDGENIGHRAELVKLCAESADNPFYGPRNPFYGPGVIRFTDQTIRFTDQTIRFADRVIRFTDQTIRFTDQVIRFTDQTIRFTDDV
jgi:hypothetical protein